jgi:hypothetical protein
MFDFGFENKEISSEQKLSRPKSAIALRRGVSLWPPSDFFQSVRGWAKTTGLPHSRFAHEPLQTRAT